MKRKIAVAAALASVLTAAACSSSSTAGSSKQATLSTDGKGKTINVWLMQDAQKGWPAVVDAAKKQFTAETGANVNIQWQTWTNYSTKLDTALLSGALNNTWDWMGMDLTLVTIPGASHFVQQDASDLVSRTMRSWLLR